MFTRRYVSYRRISRLQPFGTYLAIVALSGAVMRPHASLDVFRHHPPMPEAHEHFRLDNCLAAPSVASVIHYFVLSKHYRFMSFFVYA
jgi:hypothetical protein